MSYSLKDALIDTVTGSLEFADTKVYKERIAICEPCPKNKCRTCTVCNCVIDLKARLNKSSCPLGKWN